ncbi:hypothetical protein MKZ38_009480 [Zalerion maritima]|uniref:Haloacid dehalogenase n=1 Tax=Zalerion maritima TaxID=339359 RepID=A0AAD5RK06_9PEZI|nr:hypothetical protein MKZ38_009480 [Zalerion maritima]
MLPLPEKSWVKGIKALTFDVFGTCVDWRSSVERGLKVTAASKIQSPAFASIPPTTQTNATNMTDDLWAKFAQDWRDSYKIFTHEYVPGESPWKDIDTHHHDSLLELLAKWGLAGFFSEQETRQLSLVWHFLDPWPDSSGGIHALSSRFVTSTLSNGNHSLLQDLDRHGQLGFTRLISAADFKAYKPSPQVYLGAAEMLCLRPDEVAMVAAHLDDLMAAKQNGMKTIYVERPEEEDWSPNEEQYQEAKDWVDMWVTGSEEGFIEVARRLGLRP